MALCLAPLELCQTTFSWALIAPVASHIPAWFVSAQLVRTRLGLSSHCDGAPMCQEASLLAVWPSIGGASASSVSGLKPRPRLDWMKTLCTCEGVQGLYAGK